ncbi:MAG: hypothetical protein AAGI17_04985 [Planctomycetota bacterium]
MNPLRLHEFSIYLDQRPGELAGVLDLATSRGISVTAVSVSEHNGRGCVRLLGEPLEDLRALCESLTDSGVGPVVESEVIGVETGAVNGDDAGSETAKMCELAKALADARINVRYGYLAPAHNGHRAMCIIRVDEPDEVAKQLEQLDLGAVHQNGHHNGHSSGDDSA